MPVLTTRLRVPVAALAVAALLLGQTPTVSIAHDPPGIERFMDAVGFVESGGRYTARNPVSGAYGKYQIMPANWPAWAERYLGNRSASQTPRNQERVARGKFHDLHSWLGNWHQTAYWWLTGRDGRSGGWSSTARAYMNKVIGYYRTGIPTAPTKPGAGSSSRAMIGEASAAITYAGSWKSAGHGGYLGGRVRYATTRGATATLTFTGSAVAWYGPMGPTRGRARVLLDGVVVATVDLRASRFVARSLLFSRRVPAGAHVLTIEVLGTAGRPYVAIDAFAVTPAP